MAKAQLSSFRYAFHKGAVARGEIDKPFTEGNCRLAIQEYFYVFFGQYFTVEQIFNPEGYLHTGTFIKKDYEPDFFADLPEGTVIYAERMRNKDGETIDKSPNAFDSQEDYIIALHSAIYLGPLTPAIRAKLPNDVNADFTGLAIWHATAAAGGTCLWPLQKFLDYYKPVAAKRFTGSCQASL